MTNCCKNCKYRAGDRGNEMEFLQGKFGTNIYSNCAKFQQMVTVMFDATTTIGSRIAFNEDFCCCFHEGIIQNPSDNSKLANPFDHDKDKEGYDLYKKVSENNFECDF
jgi:hypothetical protein